MNSIEFEIGIQRKFEHFWPLVVRVKQPDGLTIHAEGTLQLSEDDLIRLTQEQENYLEYGTILGKAVFRETVRETFVRTLGQSSQETTVRFLLSNEADSQDSVRSLHWERLCAPIDAGGEWNLLARDQRIPFSQYIPTIIDRRFPPIGRLDLRALVIVASPSNLGKYNLVEFDVEQAVNTVRESLGEIPCDLLANIDGARGPPTLEQLSEQLTNAKKPYTILHFVGHGKLLKDGETVLYLATKDNEVQPVTAKQLLDELKYIGNKQGLPHLTFLCSCETADPRAETGLRGLAQRLVRDLGMPAVVGMTRKVTMETALKLAQKFYQRLREHGEVDLALDEATAGLGHRQDITVPALFSRLGGRPLFCDRLQDRELTDAEIDFGLAKLTELIAQRAPNATVLEESFKEQVQILEQTQGSQLPAARQKRREALDELNILCSQVVEISFDAIAALDKKPPIYDAKCPFPGLSSFREEKYHKFFFGRQQLVTELQQALLKDNFLAVLGPSGSGKSSVVLAGLIPQLQAEKPSLQMAYLTPNSEPVAQLQACLSQVSDQSVVLVVDQFEELFTLCNEEGQRLQFIKQLLELAESMPVIITIRADFLGECTVYEPLRQRIDHNSKLVGPMDAAQLGKAMKMQADHAYLEFEEGLNNAILAEVEQEPGAMPLLQYALRSLWERRRGRFLCYEEYEAIGKVQKAISQTADAVYDSLSGDEQEKVKAILIRLTRLDEETVEEAERRDTRRRVALEDLVPSGDDPTVTKGLVDRLAGEGARLVVTSRDSLTGKQEVEVAHEALIRHWERLQKWINDNRSNLQLRETIRRAALEWEGNKKQESYLVHRGGRLEDTEVLLQQPRFLNQKEADYVNACVGLRESLRQKELEQERKARKAAQRTAAGAVIASIVMLVMGSFTVFQWREAKISQIRTLRQSTELNWRSNQQIEALLDFLRIAKLLDHKLLQLFKPQEELERLRETLPKIVYSVQEFNRLDDVVGFQSTADGEMIVTSYPGGIAVWQLDGKLEKEYNNEEDMDTLTQSEVNYCQIPEKNFVFVIFDASDCTLDGKMFARLDEDTRKVLISNSDGTSQEVFQAHDNVITAVRFSPDSKMIATASWDTTVKLWNLDGTLPTTSIRLEGHTESVNALDFSRDEEIIASGSSDDTVKLWNRDGTLLKTIEGHQREVWGVSISPDSQVIASGSSDDTVKLWNRDGTLRKTIQGHRDTVREVRFNSDGDILASATDDRTVKLWRLKDIPLTILNHDSDKVYAVSFNPDGETIATTRGQGSVAFWDKHGMSLGTQKWQYGPITALEFSPDGTLIVSAAGDRTVRLSRADGSGIKFLQGYTGEITQKEVLAVSFSPDSQIFATGNNQGEIEIWNRDGTLKQNFLGHKDSFVRGLSFSPDGQILASASWDGTVKLWNRDGSLKETIQAPGGGLFGVAFSPDKEPGQQIIAAATQDGTVKLWDRDGTELQTIKAHETELPPTKNDKSLI